MLTIRDLESRFQELKERFDDWDKRLRDMEQTVHSAFGAVKFAAFVTPICMTVITIGVNVYFNIMK